MNEKELLEKNGKTKYWLYKQLGMSYQNFNKMINNQTTAIKFENLYSLCQILESPGENLFDPEKPAKPFPTYVNNIIHVQRFCVFSMFLILYP